MVRIERRDAGIRAMLDAWLEPPRGTSGWTRGQSCRWEAQPARQVTVRPPVKKHADAVSKEALDLALTDTRADSEKEAQFRQLVRARVPALAEGGPRRC